MTSQTDHETLWQKLAGPHPGLSKDSPFSEASWGSLEWSGFLLEALASVPARKQDEAIRKIFLETDFEKLSFNRLTGIIHELARDP
jgi:hypothetical protein